jgi:hypothetical protein
MKRPKPPRMKDMFEWLSIEEHRARLDPEVRAIAMRILASLEAMPPDDLDIFLQIPQETFFSYLEEMIAEQR